jgi:hypothetical protein
MVVAVGDQSDWVTKDGDQRDGEKDGDGWVGSRVAWGGTWVVVLSVGLRPTSLRARRPPPQTPRGAMLDSDIPSDVLACCL